MEDSLGICGNFQIIHVAESIKGGIATYLRSLVRYQECRYGAENVRLIVPRAQIGELDGLNARLLPFEAGTSRFTSAAKAALTLVRQVNRSRPNLIHIHSSFAGATCRLALMLSRRRMGVLYCPHGWAFARGGGSDWVTGIVERILARWCDAIVCITDHERALAAGRGIPNKKLRVIKNGIDDRTPFDHIHSKRLWPVGAFRLVFVGRLDRMKGFDILLDALAQVSRPVFLHAFGDFVRDDMVMNEFPSYVASHGWVRFELIEPYLASCDAIVVPSRCEAFGYSALEGLRAGKAVIGSKVGGLREVVDDGVSGVLVPPNDVGALVEAIENADIETLARMGSMGREIFLGNYTAERMEAELAKLYAECSRGGHEAGFL